MTRISQMGRWETGDQRLETGDQRPETGDGRAVGLSQRHSGERGGAIRPAINYRRQTITVFWGFRRRGLFARLRGVNKGEKVDDGKKRDKMD